MSMPDSEAKKKWDAENMRLFGIKFFRRKDQDVIDILESHNKHDIVCAALREYMKNHPND